MTSSLWWTSCRSAWHYLDSSDETRAYIHQVKRMCSGEHLLNLFRNLNVCTGNPAFLQKECAVDLAWSFATILQLWPMFSVFVRLVMAE